MAKKTTLNDIAAMLSKQSVTLEKHTKIVTTHGKDIRDLTASIAHVVKHMATKDDVRDIIRTEVPEIVRGETKDIRAELTSIRRNLEALTGKIDNILGLPKEIDHALERIAAIEKHLGIQKKIAASRR